MSKLVYLLCLVMTSLSAGESASQPQQPSSENFAMPGENTPPENQDVVDQPDCNPPAPEYPQSLQKQPSK